MSRHDPATSYADDPADDEFTELVDADFDRVDLVGKGANGRPFLVAKASAGSVLPPEIIRSLIQEPGMKNVRKQPADDPFSGLRATSQPDTPEVMAQRGTVSSQQYNLGMTSEVQRYVGQFEVESPSGQLVGRYADIAKAEDHARRVHGLIRVRGDAASAATVPVVKAASTAKADQVAVFDAKGNLVGTIDPADLIPIKSATAPESTKANPPDDLAPAPSADAGVQAGQAVAKALGGVDVAKIGDALRARLAVAGTVQEREQIQKQLDGLAMVMLQVTQQIHQARQRR